MYRGIVTPREVAVLAMNLPRGAMVWQYFGGAMAVTAEEENLWVVQHLLQQLGYQAGGGKGQKPKLREYPEGLKAQKDRGQRAVRNAEAFRRKHLNP